jgi:hypothetical protein
MADTKQQQEELKKNQNWAEMESEGDDDNEEIGVAGAEKQEGENQTEEVKKEKKSWKELQAEKRAEEKRKAANAPIVRHKNERGDYVVTGFSIPDRLD